jgi:ADP-L-glycero-D-manno-heptose 6-epimerase
MRAVVTGGTGFIGSNLASGLRELGWDVHITGREGEQALEFPCLGYDFSNIDWQSLDGVDVLFHQAAISDTTITDEKAMYDVNCWKSLQLFERARRCGVKHIVYASSCATYGDVLAPFVESGPLRPLNVYGKSKLKLDEYAMKWGENTHSNIVGLRYSNVYGRNEGHKGKTACMVTQIGNCIRDGQKPRLFKWGEQKRDFVYIKDVIDYNLKAATFRGQQVFNAGSGMATSFNDVVAVFNEHFGVNIEPEYIDNPYKGAYQDHTLCEMTKAANILGVKSSWGLRDAIKDYYCASVDGEVATTF